MRIAYFDCPSGASGDMVLGALVDAGCELETLEAALGSLGVEGWRLEARAVRARRAARHAPRRAHRIPAGGSTPSATCSGPSSARRLSDAVKGRATAVLQRLAEAEARVHRVPVDAVHFHEVGDLDTLVDVVGSVAGLDALGVDRVHVSPLPIGGGTVETAHGRLPVPAPATAELLRGFPVYDNGIASELVTPTGAAILTTLGTPGPPPRHDARAHRLGARAPASFRCRTCSACWWARRRPPRREPARRRDAGQRGDHHRRHVAPALRAARRAAPRRAGALDVYLTPVVMKRTRPGTVLTALAPPELADRLAEILFRETTTIGVRWSEVRRRRLPRELVRLSTVVRAGHLQGLDARRPRRSRSRRSSRRCAGSPTPRDARFARCSRRCAWKGCGRSRRTRRGTTRAD